jgi:hypothetical protein
MRASVRGVLLGAVALLTLGVAPATAGAATFYARGGSGGKTSCAQGDECSVAKAVKEAEKAGAGSNVVLVAGPNFTPSEVVTVNGAIDVGGAPGATRPTIVGPSGEGAVIVSGGAHVHDVNLVAGGGNYTLDIFDASVERVFAESTTTGTVACNFFDGTMTDSVCFAKENTGVFMGGSTATHTAHLRNVDAIGKVVGIEIFGPLSASYENRLEGVNVISRGGPTFSDVATSASSGAARVALTNSDYDSVDFIGGAEHASITQVGTNGNLTAPPLFVNEAGADFHQLVGSPTVDNGVTEPVAGLLDLDGNPRSLTAHPVCGGPTSGPTDIGAYEYVPPVLDCPAPPLSPGPPPPPITPAKPPAPGTTLKKAKIDSDKGTASFTFAGSGAVSGFACELVRPAPKAAKTSKGAKRSKPKFSGCESPKAYRHLVPGAYTFKVEAQGAGGADATPAVRKFRIKP